MINKNNGAPLDSTEDAEKTAVWDAAAPQSTTDHQPAEQQVQPPETDPAEPQKKKIPFGVICVCALILLAAVIMVFGVSHFIGGQITDSIESEMHQSAVLESWLETELLPNYGVIDTENALYAADAPGVLSVYMLPRGSEMLICRIDTRSLVAERYAAGDDGTVSLLSSGEFPEIFDRAFQSDSPIEIAVKDGRLMVADEPILTLGVSADLAVTIGSVEAETKSSAWEHTTFRFRDRTDFRSRITLPAETAEFELPDMAGMALEEAVDYLRSIGMNAETELVESDEIERGWIVTQSPAPGSSIKRGSTVWLSVSAEAFLFRYTIPAGAEGTYYMVLYDAEDGSEIVRDKLLLTAKDEDVPSFTAGMKITGKRSFEALLEDAKTGESAELGTYTADNDGAADADPQALKDALIELGGLTELPAETTTIPTENEPDETEPAAAEEDADWKQLYAEYLTAALEEGFPEYDSNSVKFDLIYLDNDDIPELIIGASEQTNTTAKLCCILDGGIYETNIGYGKFLYLEKQNRLFTEYRNSYYATYQIMQLKDGALEALTVFRETWSLQNGYRYRCDANTVDSKTYAEELEKAYHVDGQTEWEYTKRGWYLTEQAIRNHLT